MATTLGTITNLMYSILRETGPSSAYPLDLMELFANSAQTDILAGRVTNPFTGGLEARAGQLPFMNQDLFYINVLPTTLTVQTNIGDDVINVATTTYFPDSGVLYLAGDMVTYTGKTDTTFTGCTNVLFPFPAGLSVNIAYILPTDYSSVLNVVYNNTMKLLPKLYDDIFEDLNNNKGTSYQQNLGSPYAYRLNSIGPFYTTKDDLYLLPFNVNNVNAMIIFRYIKTPEYMSTPSTPCSIPDDVYARTVIPMLAVADMLYFRGEEQRAADIKNFGITKLRAMYSFYNDTSYESISGNHYSMQGGKLNVG